jgi:membrane dipeptidase
MPKNNSPFPRREFLAAAVGVGGAALLGRRWLHAASDAAAGRDSLARDSDPRLAQVKALTIGIDMHNHVYPPGTEMANSPMSWLQGLDDGPPLLLSEQLKLAGLTAVAANYKTDVSRGVKPGETLPSFLSWCAAMDAELEKEHMRRALRLKDLEAAHSSGQPTIVQAVEGAMFLEGHLDRVELVYKRGLRHLQLLHDEDDLVAPLGDLDSRPAHLGGLTAFGAEVIRECNRLGILVDMAHSSPETILAATKVSTQPFIVSHTGFDRLSGDSRNGDSQNGDSQNGDSQNGDSQNGDSRMAEMMKPRLLNKERAKVIADAGGVIGVWLIGAESPKDYVEGIKMMVDAAGIDHVGIGTDSNLLSARRGTNSAWPGVTGGFFNVVAAEMLAQGFTPDEIAKVGGGNYCRVFGAATAGHA